MSRRLRAFKRWMRSQGIICSDALELTDGGDEGISVRSVCGLAEGDLVATIPKNACLTIKTSAAREMIEEAGLAGSLGLSVALMYEKSLGEASPWAGYLQILPERECLPVVWTLDEVDTYLHGTELHKTVKEDKSHIYEDWKECILPLVDFGPLKLNPKSFEVEQYLAARSLVSSRAFEIDDYHGYGMVPLADLFNHKTGAEDIHFTSVCSHPGSNDGDNIESNDEYDRNADEDLLTENFHSRDGCSLTADAGNYYLNCSDVDSSSNSGDDPMILELILVKDVKAGDEVFNTYGSMGNAALLHRYGFTEPDNPFDIVNIELNLVTKWSSLLFSARYTRARLLFWRRLGFSGCISHSCEYFEISSDGEPQLELVILLYIICLPEVLYDKLNNRVSSVENINESMNILLLHKNNVQVPLGTTEIDKDLLLTKNVCDALHSLANIRESFYGQNSLEDDMEALRTCCMRERKLYHSLTLRVTERRILKKLRTYASSR